MGASVPTWVRIALRGSVSVVPVAFLSLLGCGCGAQQERGGTPLTIDMADGPTDFAERRQDPLVSEAH